MDIERTIGADIMMAFDECPPGDSDYEYAKKSLGLTHRWLDRCIKRFNETEPKYGYQQSLFPIVRVASIATSASSRQSLSPLKVLTVMPLAVWLWASL